MNSKHECCALRPPHRAGRTSSPDLRPPRRRLEQAAGGVLGEQGAEGLVCYLLPYRKGVVVDGFLWHQGIPAVRLNSSAAAWLGNV